MGFAKADSLLLNARQIMLLESLFAEARENNFSVILEKG
jgi:hypothetical protein